MIHDIQSFDAAPWQDRVRVGDIVAFRFPHEDEGGELPKVRPALILDLEERDGQRFAVLAYGTTSPKLTKTRAPYAVDVVAVDELATASLNRLTRFHGARRIAVSLNHPWFAVSAKRGTARLGCLSGQSRERLQQVRNRIHAERDIRADRRRARRWPPARPASVARKARAKELHHG